MLSRGTILVALGLALAVVLVGASLVFAQDWGPYGYGHPHGWGPMLGGPRNSLIAVSADQLRLTVDQLIAELQAGKTIAQLAEARGVELQTILEAFIAQPAQILEAAVAQGRISQDQADWMLSHMRANVAQHLTQNFPLQARYGSGARGRWDHGFGAAGPRQAGLGMMGWWSP